MGSGHILVYMFDVLVQIYEAYGYDPRSAARSIVEHNLYGLDIDERSAQLAYFSVMMKARSYDRRFFSRGSAPKVYAIRESNDVDANALEYFVNGDPALKAAMNSILSDMHDAKEYGSIIHVRTVDFAALYARFDEIADDIHISARYCLDELLPLVQAAEVLAGKYQVVCTNPPYMGSSNMDATLSSFVKKYYPDSKSDLFAVFIERCGTLTAQNGYQAMITQHAWMFLSSFEKLRNKLLQKNTVNMAHLGPRAFEEIGGEVVQTTSFVLQNCHNADYKGVYCRLIEPTTQQGKEELFLTGEKRYTAQQFNFAKIPGSPLAYWVPIEVFLAFSKYKPVSAYGEAKAGMTTGDNNRFLRLWHEVSFSDIGLGMHNKEEAIASQKEWFPYNKGGGFRKWYGLNEYVVLWANNGEEIKGATERGRKIASVRSERLYFRKSITWATLTSGMISCRLSDYGHLFDDKGSSCFMPDEFNDYVLAYINTNVGDYFLHILNPTMSFQSGNIGALPIVEDMVNNTSIGQKCEENVALSKSDWDAFETSWDFKKHPLA